METRDKAFTLYKKGMGCTEISKKLGVSLNTVKSWKKRYWDAQKGAPKKRTSSHPKGASSKCAQQDPAAQPEKRPNRGGAPKGNVNAVGNHGGAPPGNQNALKHGGWSAVMFGAFSEENQKAIQDCTKDVDAEDLLIQELQLLTAREAFLLQRITAAQEKKQHVQSVHTSKSSRSFTRLDEDKEKEAHLAATGGATADDENDPAAGGDPTKPTEDDGEDDATTPDVLADITARRNAMEDGPAKSDINTLLSMLEAEKARADAAEDDAKQPPTEDEDDASDNDSGQLNHDSLDAIVKKKVGQRMELCRLGDKLHLDGMDTLPVMQAKKKVIRTVLPGMRLDGKGNAYINAAFDIAKGKVDGRKTVNDQRRQVFNADSANAATHNANAKNDPDAARTRMIQRHAGEKED